MPETLEAISPEAAEESLREALTAPAPEATEATDKSEPVPQQTAEATEAKGEKLPDSLTDDTRATADKSEAIPKNKETQKPKSELNPNGNKPSPFSQNGQRLEKKWTAVIARDAELTAKEASIKQQEAALKQQQERIQLDVAKARQKFTPEQYETAATNKSASAEQLNLQADGLDRRAEQLEEAGDYDKAELTKKQAQDLREQANGEKYSARQMKDMAENLRKNPDPTLAQHQATMEQHKRHYLLEAAKVWPDVAKDGSEFQKTMAGHLQEIAKQGIDPNENPIVFYHVARLTAAETAAARVSKVEKELGAAQARVKELEGLTAPGGGQSATQKSDHAPTDFSKMTLEQQEAWLRQAAA